MKRLLPALIALTITQLCNSQNAIPNPGFESWNTNPLYDDPVGWGTINGLTYILGVKTVSKTSVASEVHSGTYAIKLESKNVPGQGVAPGIAATGTINPSTQAVDGGVAYNQRPVSFTGWYLYQPSGVDTCSIEARLSRWNNGQREEVGVAEFTQSNTVSNYTQFNVNFSYSSASLPDTLVITILTSAGGNNSPNGTKLWVDDLAFVSTPSAISDVAFNKINVYPNPATNNIVIETGVSNSQARLSLFDSQGKLVDDAILVDERTVLNLEHLSNGFYTYCVTDINTLYRSYGKLLIHK